MEYKIQSKLLKHLSKVVQFADQNEASPYEEDESPGYTFDLICGTNGNIVIIARDENGKKVPHGNILSLTAEGRVKRYKNVPRELGFKLNSKGQVALEK